MKIRSDMVIVFLVRPDGAGSWEFLQLKRCDGEFMNQTWQTVRGGIDAGETAPQTALREIREETGLSPKEFYRLCSPETFYMLQTDSVCFCGAFCAIVDRDQQVKLNHEHDDFRWVPRVKIEQMTMWASERRLLAELMHDILDDSSAKQLLRLK